MEIIFVWKLFLFLHRNNNLLRCKYNKLRANIKEEVK